MKKWHRSEVAANGTAWTVEASMDDGRLTIEVIAASELDGTVELQLTIEGSSVHLGILEGILRELRSELVGRPAKAATDTYRIKTGLPNAYRPWTEAEEKVLIERWETGDTMDLIAQRLGRGSGGVRSRLVKLGRIEVMSQQPEARSL